MANSLPHRLSLALAATAAASALAAAPALATEPPNAPPPSAPLPTAIAPVTIAPLPSTAARSGRAPRVIRRARLVPRRVRRGQRAQLKLSLTTPSRLRIVMSRGGGGRRSRAAALSVPASGRTISLRLPARSRGRALRPGRYRVSIVAIDAQGARSLPVNRTLIVRRAAR